MIRRRGETQRAFVERVLREDGSISTYDVLYRAAYEDGARTSVTRLAAIIYTLRQEGAQIVETAGHGQLATYSLREATEPEWRRGWHCMTCAGLPASAPFVMLGGFGRAACSTCGPNAIFRKTVAA